MNPTDPIAALVAAIDATVKEWGWLGLALIPVAVAGVAVRRLSTMPAPPPEFEPEELWRKDGMALWRKFDEVVGRG